jgi:hypothetical protein
VKNFREGSSSTSVVLAEYFSRNENSRFRISELFDASPFPLNCMKADHHLGEPECTLNRFIDEQINRKPKCYNVRFTPVDTSELSVFPGELPTLETRPYREETVCVQLCVIVGTARFTEVNMRDPPRGFARLNYRPLTGRKWLIINSERYCK